MSHILMVAGKATCLGLGGLLAGMTAGYWLCKLVYGDRAKHEDVQILMLLVGMIVGGGALWWGFA